jgi:hypothetical protein
VLAFCISLVHSASDRSQFGKKFAVSTTGPV